MKKSSIIYILHNYARPLRKVISLLILLNLAANLIAACQPIVFAGVMNILIGQGDGAVKKQGASLLDLNHIGGSLMGALKAYVPDKWGLLIVMGSIFVLIAALSSIFTYLAYLYGCKIEARAQRLIQMDLLRHLLSLSMSFFNRQKTGELMSRLTQDAKNTAVGLGPLITSLMQNSILIIVYSLYLFNTNVILTLVALLLILFQFGLTQIVRKPIVKTMRASLDKNAEFSNTLQEIFTSIRVMRLFGGEKYELEKLDQGIVSVTNADMKAGMVKHLQEPTRAILDSFAMVGIVLIAARQLMNGTLSLQGFALFIYVGQLLITPINKFAVTLSWTHALIASYSKINELLSLKADIVDGTKNKRDFLHTINLNNVAFSYGNNLVLENISFDIKKNNIIAIVGPSGSGKSTLVDLILKFYEPLRGSISIDEVDLREVKYDQYRKIFGVVPQRNVLFNDSVRNNILYGRNHFREEDVREAISIANAAEFIDKLPNGIDSVIGEKGIFLSGGQCQRLAIARAVLARPQILILDEATSSLDSESERLVQQAIDRVIENSTAIVIAHRLSTVMHAHKIVVLQDGKIEAIGTHSELLIKSPTYKMLYEFQFREPERSET